MLKSNQIFRNFENINSKYPNISEILTYFLTPNFALSWAVKSYLESKRKGIFIRNNQFKGIFCILYQKRNRVSAPLHFNRRGIPILIILLPLNRTRICVLNILLKRNLNRIFLFRKSRLPSFDYRHFSRNDNKAV